MFKNTLDNKRYHTLNYYFKNKFGQKIAKIPLDAHMTCPNKKTGGCIYCSNYSKSNIIDEKKDIKDQYIEGKKIIQKKWPNAKFIAYFQSGTNTFTEINHLKEMIEPVINEKDNIGIAIATRPDCITEECYNYLNELNKKTFLMIEIGLQSSNNNTLNFINRGHDKECFEKCIKRLKELNIFTVAHIINGLPYESKEDMISTAKFINDLNLDAIKIHMLYVAKNTPLEKIYNEKKLHLLSKEEYIDIVCEQLEYLNENMVIERITGDPIKEELIEPTWLLKKFVVLNDIDKEMKKRNIYQSDKTSNDPRL